MIASQIRDGRIKFGELVKTRFREKNINYTQLVVVQYNGETYHFGANFLSGIVNGHTFFKDEKKFYALCDLLGIKEEDYDLNLLVVTKFRKRFGLNGTSNPQIDYLLETVTRPSNSMPGYPIGTISKYGFIIGASQAMQDIFLQIENIVQLRNQDSPILITGETGTGKELVAKAIHYNGPRKEKPYIGINITTVTETLIESELFGHKAGSFTDAKETTPGFFETVDGGTLLLDEIGSLPQNIQAKLLRIIQERQFYRIGDRNSRKFEGRLITATKEDLETLVKEGEFRDDLFFRLDVLRINMPPLRGRDEDILLLFNHLIINYNEKYNTEYNVNPTTEGMNLLLKYSYPGNVRELESIIIKAIAKYPNNKKVLVEEVITPKLDSSIITYTNDGTITKEAFLRAFDDKLKGLNNSLKSRAIISILEALYDHKLNLSEVARQIGVARNSVYTRLSNVGIKVDDIHKVYNGK